MYIVFSLCSLHQPTHNSSIQKGESVCMIWWHKCNQTPALIRQINGKHNEIGTIIVLKKGRHAGVKVLLLFFVLKSKEKKTTTFYLKIICEYKKLYTKFQPYFLLLLIFFGRYCRPLKQTNENTKVSIKQKELTGSLINFRRCFSLLIQFFPSSFFSLQMKAKNIFILVRKLH